MEFEHTIDDGACLLRMRGDFKSADAREADSRLRIILEDPAVKGVALDLSGFGFPTSATIGWLAQTHRTLAERGRRLALHDPTPMMLRLINNMSLDGVLKILPNAALAAAHARGESAAP